MIPGVILREYASYHRAAIGDDIEGSEGAWFYLSRENTLCDHGLEELVKEPLILERPYELLAHLPFDDDAYLMGWGS